MKTHRGTVEALIDLHEQWRGKYDDQDEDEDDKPSAEAMADYLTDPDRAKFCCIVSNLDPDVRLELHALLWVGRDDGHTAADFDDLVAHAKTTSCDGDGKYLSGKIGLVASWRRGMDIMGLT